MNRTGRSLLGCLVLVGSACANPQRGTGADAGATGGADAGARGGVGGLAGIGGSGGTGGVGGSAGAGGTNATGGATGGIAATGGGGGGGATGGSGGTSDAGSKDAPGSADGASDAGANDAPNPADAGSRLCDITQYGAKADGTTLNTKAIQATIDACAAAGGGTVVVPKGIFLTGALFLKAAVNLQLLDGAVLLASKNISDFPVSLTRFEGHFSNRPASLLTAEKVDHLRISGPGTLDGNGAAYWSADLPQGRPRLCFIRDSRDVIVSGVHFKNSPSWNLHFYNCQTVVVEGSRFEIDANADGPSTDGTDIDSSQDVTVRGCTYSVNDDCVVLKGNRYDGLNQTPASLPVSNVHVTNCTFLRGKGALSVGTEATYVHDVELDNSSVSGDFPTLRLKMRPDTAGQRYENINVHDIKVNGTDDIVAWELTHGTAITGTPPPASIRNVTLANVTGSTASFGNIAANKTTTVSAVTMKNINVTLTAPTLVATGVTGLTMDNVVVNGKLWSATASNGAPGPVP